MAATTAGYLSRSRPDWRPNASRKELAEARFAHVQAKAERGHGHGDMIIAIVEHGIVVGVEVVEQFLTRVAVVQPEIQVIFSSLTVGKLMIDAKAEGVEDL